MIFPHHIVLIYLNTNSNLEIVIVKLMNIKNVSIEDGGIDAF